MRGTINVLAVKAPGFGDRRKAMLEDMAILTGGKVISEEVGRKLDSATVQDLGRARRVVSTKDNTTIIEGHGEDAAIQGRIRQIRAQVDETTSDYDREKLQERLAELAGGVRGDQGRRGHRGRAAEGEEAPGGGRRRSATRAAVEEGIVPGGGVALSALISALEKVVAAELKGQGDIETGVSILRRALEEPSPPHRHQRRSGRLRCGAKREAGREGCRLRRPEE